MTHKEMLDLLQMVDDTHLGLMLDNGYTLGEVADIFEQRAKAVEIVRDALTSTPRSKFVYKCYVCNTEMSTEDGEYCKHCGSRNE